MGSEQPTTATNREKSAGKILAPLDQKLQGVEWGEYRLGDLFEVQTVKSIDEGKLHLVEQKQDGFFEFVGRTKTNNGVKGYTKKLHLNPNPEHVISVSQIGTIVAQLREEKWYASQNIFSLTPKKSFEALISLYGVAVVNKSLDGSFSPGYANYPTLEKLKTISISLPTKNGEIDFAFMESFIAELEAERIAELEAYLLVTELKDYTLTTEEKKALDDFENIKFEEFNVIDIFGVKNTGNILSRDVVENSGETPYLCASAENNAVSSYISFDEKQLDKGNCVFIGGKTFVVTYQEKDFYSNDSHNLVLYLKEEEKRNRLIQLYLATCINKSLGHKYSWGNSISNTKIKKDKVALPTQNNQPDYGKMETFMSAIQKMVIKNVVVYADEKITATKKVVEKNNHLNTPL